MPRINLTGQSRYIITNLNKHLEWDKRIVYFPEFNSHAAITNRLKKKKKKKGTEFVMFTKENVTMKAKTSNESNKSNSSSNNKKDKKDGSKAFGKKT